MADTVLYFTSTTYSGTNYAPSNQWDASGGMTRRDLLDFKTSDLVSGATFQPSGSGFYDAVNVMGISPSLVGSAVTLNDSTTFKCYMRGRAESSGIIKPRVFAKLLDSTGAVKATLLNVTGSTETLASSGFYAREVYNGFLNSGVSVGIDDGDRVVVEVGIYVHPLGSNRVKYVVGAPSTVSDIPISGYMNNQSGVGWCSIGKRLEFN